jgi:hypothetical protein
MSVDSPSTHPTTPTDPNKRKTPTPKSTTHKPKTPHTHTHTKQKKQQQVRHASAPSAEEARADHHFMQRVKARGKHPIRNLMYARMRQMCLGRPALVWDDVSSFQVRACVLVGWRLCFACGGGGSLVLWKEETIPILKLNHSLTHVNHHHHHHHRHNHLSYQAPGGDTAVLSFAGATPVGMDLFLFSIPGACVRLLGLWEGGRAGCV